MRCTSPKTVGFYSDGKTICFSKKKYSKQYPPFQIPCGKCISCRLENARQTALRCVHEASMYEKNSFITLTYDENHLGDNKLRYKDFQLFVKKLRSHIYDNELKKIFPKQTSQMERRSAARSLTKQARKNIHERISISIYCAGEYGDRGKRAHWHALIFNWEPSDKVYKYQNELGDVAFSSATLTDLWGQGLCEFGSVTFKSASYCARYATKKLAHGPDDSHPYAPISRRSCKNAVGKKWLEKNWRDVFTHGYIIFFDGQKYVQCGIPRYYEKWFKKTHPEEWIRYVTQTKQKIIDSAILKESKISLEEKKVNLKRSSLKGLQIRRNKVREKILEKKTKEIQHYQKL